MLSKAFYYVAILTLLFVSKTESGFSQKPTSYQLNWHEKEFYLFIHFGPNTFTDVEWGDGRESSDIFNPSSLDCRQWCQIARSAGAGGIIITAKHHDGFCLWPSRHSSHTVAQSSWKNGKGDVLKELSESCREYGLSFGVYISPWDRNHPNYGTEEYNDTFVAMMEEIFNSYGPIWELWWDGANGEGPNGKTQVYDWKRFVSLIRKISPSTVIFSDVGPDIRWVGNEKGIASETNWNTLNVEGFQPGLNAPPTDTLQMGNIYGEEWVPAECDVSIRPGWFYHKAEDQKVKSPEVLFDLYLKSVGRGANFLLNVPPDYTGRIHRNDSLSLVALGQLLNHQFKVNICRSGDAKLIQGKISDIGDVLTDGNERTFVSLHKNKEPEIRITFDRPEKINCVSIQENIANGQYIRKADIQLLNEKNEVILKVPLTTIGRKRLATFATQTASSLVFRVLDAKGDAEVSEIAAYKLDDALLGSK